MAVIILLVATYLNYLRHARPKMGLRLAIEGWSGEGVPAAGAEQPYTRKEEMVGDGDAQELGQTGQETIYRGLLWMKEKYEEYREQADRRYQQMREELGRSEQRYHALIEVMEQNKRRALEIVGGEVPANAEPVAGPAGPSEPEGGTPGVEPEGGTPGVEPEGGTRGVEPGVAAVADQLADARGQLGIKQVVIDELKGQLLAERLKVEELVAILQTNTQMLRKVIPDLGK